METSRPVNPSAPAAPASRNPWYWIPTLYFAEGLPNAVVVMVSVALYQRLGVGKEKIGFYTSCLYLPWVVKPLWSPFVDTRGAKRTWVAATQFVIAGCLALAAAAAPAKSFFVLTLSAFWLMAIASATHDIAADGFYMLGLTPHKQALWSGLRSAFYRAATAAGAGGLLTLAGFLEPRMQTIARAWTASLACAAGVFLILACWHLAVLPHPASDGPAPRGGNLMADFWETLSSFFRKPGAGLALAFILLYRLDEAQLSKMISPFLFDSRAAGGLALTTLQVGLAYGTLGIVALTCGGLLGGWMAARHGLKKMLPIMVVFMYLPKLAYIGLAWAQPDNFPLICGAVALEQFGYGFGFTAFTLYLLYFADGPRRTAHYALCTGFMAAGLMIPGLWSGLLAQSLGYKLFFICVAASALPGLFLAFRLRIDPHFGKK